MAANDALAPAELAALRAEVRAAPQLLTYLKLRKRLGGEPAAGRKVAVVSSYTVRPLEPYLAVEAALSGWRIAAGFTEYSLWQQALLAPPDDLEACVLLLHLGELIGDARDAAAAAETAAASLAGVLAGFRARSGAPLVIARVSAPAWAGAQAFGDRGAASLSRAAATVNAAIDAFAAQHPQAHAIDLPQPSDGDAGAEGLARTLSPIAPTDAPRVAEAVARALSGFFRPRRKVLVTDLDNTLWHGVVGEVGPEGIGLAGSWPGEAHRQLQRAMLDLSRSGVLLAVNSKNNEADARAAFERDDMLLRWDDFAAHRVNWQDKAENIGELARELSLGTDSFVFVDDSAIECARIRAAFPEVEVVQLPEDPARFVDALIDCRGFDALSVTREDLARAEGVKAERKRTALQAAAVDLSGFLASLDLTVAIRPCDDATRERIHQLFNKTNQFHLTLERPGLADLARRGDGLYALSLRDRFGDYGVIGALEIAADGEALQLRNLALSCRALGRRVEETALAFAVEQARRAGAKTLTARLVRGPRNAPAWEFVARAGFAARDAGERVGDPAGQWFGLDLASAADGYPPEVSVTRPEPAPALAAVGR
ncbi:MAG: HAD-IIIC family phosphatase [Alphaproteobacteria bacterium]